MKSNNSPVRGTKDYLPYEQAVREYVKSIILKTYKSYGFMQIGTPVLEDIDNLLGSDGGDNLKLIFKVLKRGEKLDLTTPNLTEKDIVDIGLKYDQTVPLARMFSNNQNSLPLPFKSIQIDYAFRADRPQLGRNRQFVQCDIDILGDPTINAEIDILNTSAKTFSALGFSNVVAKINDRRILSDLIAFFGFAKQDESEILVSLDKFDKIGFDGVKEELISKNFDKDKVLGLLQVIAQVQSTSSIDILIKYGVRPEILANLQKLLDSLSKLATSNFKAVFDISIIRGQGYYTGLVYEFFLPGISSACGGGGRYDRMIEKMTGTPVSAVGFSIGFERVCLLFLENNMYVPNELEIAVMYSQDDDFVEVLKYVQSINREQNASAILMKNNINHQLEVLKQNGFTHYCKFKEKNIKKI